MFINVYAPNTGPDRAQFLNELSVVLSQCGPAEVLCFGGDFNCTENNQMAKDHIEPHAASKRAMKQLVEVHKLTDVWREMHDKHRQYTWVNFRTDAD